LEGSNSVKEQTEFDYIIVGGGSAGAVLARRLADDESVKVCLIEGGAAFEDDPQVLLLKESLAWSAT
jgi:choline dehydrogenase-like flavoprotein